MLDPSSDSSSDEPYTDKGAESDNKTTGTSISTSLFHLNHKMSKDNVTLVGNFFVQKKKYRLVCFVR